MRKHFTQLPDKIFKIITVFYGLLGDVLICAYLWRQFSDISNFFKIMNNLFPMDLKAFDDQFKEQLFLLNLQSLRLILALYLFLHCTFYICLLLNKKFAYNYFKFFVWVAAPCCLSFGVVSLFERSGVLNGLFFVQGLLYLYVALGFYYKKVGATN